MKKELINKPFDFSFSVTKTIEKGRFVEGYFSTPDVDRDKNTRQGIAGEIVEPKAFEKSFKQYMDNGGVVLFNHDPNKIAGKVVKYRIDKNGAWVKVKIIADDIWQMIKEGVLKCFSWYGEAKKFYETVKEGVKGTIRVLSDVDLFEITLTPTPMNPKANFEISKSLNKLFKEVQKADTKPYGNVEYADPGYQKDGVKRYPIDTEAHIRAAWSYIHMPKNRTFYSADQLKKIENKIRLAGKKFGIDFSAKQLTNKEEVMPKKVLKKKEKDEAKEEEKQEEVVEEEKVEEEVKEEEPKEGEVKEEDAPEEKEEASTEETKEEKEPEVEEEGKEEVEKEVEVVEVEKSALSEIESLYSKLGEKIAEIKSGKSIHRKKAIVKDEPDEKDERLNKIEKSIGDILEVLKNVPTRKAFKPVLDKFDEIEKQKSQAELEREKSLKANEELLHLIHK